jgi:hypothetical protein
MATRSSNFFKSILVFFAVLCRYWNVVKAIS